MTDKGVEDAWGALFGEDSDGIELLGFDQVAKLLSAGGVPISRHTVEEERRQGRGPRFIKFGARYLTTKGEVQRWLVKEFASEAP